MLDFFAGSGTTAHAVINLNREDGGRRKYILVETNEYFDTVTLPRVKKVADQHYSKSQTGRRHPRGKKDLRGIKILDRGSEDGLVDISAG